jgi:hypothetical protein
MEERIVWRLVLEDLLGIMPFHVIRHISHLMSTHELRQRAIRATRIDSLLDHKVVHPTNICVHAGWSDVSKAVIAPGGLWMLMLNENGSIRLQMTRDLTEAPALVIPRPECAASSQWNVTDMNNNIIITSVREHYVVVASESFNAPEYVFKANDTWDYMADFLIAVPNLHSSACITWTSGSRLSDR